MTPTLKGNRSTAMQARARARSKARAALAMSIITEEPSSVSSVSSVPLEDLPFAIPVSIVPPESRTTNVNRLQVHGSLCSRPVSTRNEISRSTAAPSTEVKRQVPSSARSRSPPTLGENPSSTTTPTRITTTVTAVKNQKHASRSVRSRPVPLWDMDEDPQPTPSSKPEKTTNQKQTSGSVRSLWDMDEDPQPTASSKPERTTNQEQTSSSVRSRPLPLWDSDSTASSSESDSNTTWKPRAIKTRPASSPSTRMLRSKPSKDLASTPSAPVSTPTPRTTEATERRRKQVRRTSNPPARKAATPQEMARSKSSTNLVSTPSAPSKQPQSCRQITSRARRMSSPTTRSRSSSLSSSDGGPGPTSSAKLDLQPDMRPRSSSSSAAVPSLTAKEPRKADFSSRLRKYEGKFQNRRGQSLFYLSLFPPEKMAMRGVILSLHGIGDHCRRSIEFYEKLCKEGFGVLSYDLLNHGASDYDQYNTRAHISSFNHLVDDTNDFITFAKRSIYPNALRYWRKHHHPRHPHGKFIKRVTLPELPLIIAGTSYGSLIGLHTVLSGEHKFHASVWGSPTVGVTWSPLLWAQSKLARPLVRLLPTAKVVPAVQHHLWCRDPEFLTKFKADPLTSLDMMTTSTGQESLQAMLRLQRDARVSDPDSAFCAVPMIFLAGSLDGVSDQQAAIKLFASMGNFDKEFKLFDGLYHKVFEEPEKEDVLEYLAQWLRKRFPIESRHPSGSPLDALKKLEGTAMRDMPLVRAPRTEL